MGFIARLLKIGTILRYTSGILNKDKFISTLLTITARNKDRLYTTLRPIAGFTIFIEA